MRLPYAPDTPAVQDSESSAIDARLAAPRAPHPLLALDLTLLHSPNVADGWNSFLGAVRTQTSLPADIREIAICRIAALNSVVHEWGHHAPLAKQSGLSNEGLKSLASPAMTGSKRLEDFSDRQWAVVRYSDAMTKEIVVSEEVFGSLKEQFSEQEIVELTATVAAYNCVSRFLVALDVGEKNGVKILAP